MDTLAARQQMVDQQIRTWEVLDRACSMRCPRCRAKRSSLRSIANLHSPMPPYPSDSARLCWLPAPGPHLQALGPGATDSALEVGSGTGYLSAALSLLCASTHSIDIHPALIESAAANLRAVPGARVQFEIRDAFDASPLKEYDVVAVTGRCRFTIRVLNAACASGAVYSSSSAWPR